MRVRDAKRLPKTLDHREVVALLESLRTWRDRAVAGLMVFCGLRSSEVLALDVADVDIGARWLRVSGKGGKERRVPLDMDVAGVIGTYLLSRSSCRGRCPGSLRPAWSGRRARPRRMRSSFAASTRRAVIMGATASP